MRTRGDLKNLKAIRRTQPMAKQKTEPQTYAKPDRIRVRGNEVLSPLRQKWLKMTPEEKVRQEFVLHLQTS
jgi:hypothetical protein